MPNVLIIDDERAIRSTIREILEYENYRVDEAADGQTALTMLEAKSYDLALCDIRMPGLDGLQVLERAKKAGVTAEFIMLSAHGTIDVAVSAVKGGAYDFISKPPDLNRLLITLRNAGERGSLVRETTQYRKRDSSRYEMVGSSAALEHIREMIDKIAPTQARVLITGPSGAGKELVARALHKQSARCQGPFIDVNCAAIPSELIESDLFGHEKGSFTSAHKQKAGRFELAQGGTIFLDEIGDMSLSAQAKVLRALQENKITRVGGDKDIVVDVRVVAATNKDLLAEVEKGTFRLDLYHRLSTMIIPVPHLKDRLEDMPELVDKFIGDLSEANGLTRKAITPQALKKLQQYHWPGNIRELRNIVERLLILSDQVIDDKDVDRYLIL